MSDALAAYEQALAELEGLSKAEVEARLAGIPWPGARPTDEHDQYPGIVVPFDQTWANHEQARAWAREVLSGVPTVAVDGSQITPSKDISVPVGAVQIGWFVNPHDGDQAYVKDIYFEVLAPDELAGEDEEIVGFPDWRVNARRFVLECEMLVETMHAARDAAVKPVCFLRWLAGRLLRPAPAAGAAAAVRGRGDWDAGRVRGMPRAAGRLHRHQLRQRPGGDARCPRRPTRPGSGSATAHCCAPGWGGVIARWLASVPATTRCCRWSGSKYYDRCALST